MAAVSRWEVLETAPTPTRHTAPQQRILFQASALPLFASEANGDHPRLSPASPHHTTRSRARRRHTSRDAPPRLLSCGFLLLRARRRKLRRRSEILDVLTTTTDQALVDLSDANSASDVVSLEAQKGVDIDESNVVTSGSSCCRCRLAGAGDHWLPVQDAPQTSNGWRTCVLMWRSRHRRKQRRTCALSKISRAPSPP